MVNNAEVLNFMDYNKTVNLPKTQFEMRANLPKKEPDIIKRWEEEDYYRQLRQTRKDAETFILHDGPPYANGNIHLGTALNKILKDIIIRYNNMQGFNCPYIPGWDTHGLPIEQQAIKNLGLNRHDVSVTEFRDKCKEYALKYMDIQREEFKRLGVWGRWEDPYLTLKPEYEAAQIRLFGKMAEKGYIYKGLKPVYWCADCETALAEAEVEYADRKSASIFVRFFIEDGKDLLKSGQDCVVIWTTTPWTLPANMAVSLNPDEKYALVRIDGKIHVLAEKLYASVLAEVGITDYQVEQVVEATALTGITYRHPFLPRVAPIIFGEHVTMEQGSGCVHTAPGHGVEDFEVGKLYGLEVVSPITDRGVLTEEAGPYSGQFYAKANKLIVEGLVESGHLLYTSEIEHSYPHCWRCKKPILFRATEQWFASVEGFRQEALAAIASVRWIPGWGQERISNMVAGRNDWCISRQRTWGVPIPIFYCEKCNEPLITPATIDNVADIFHQEGSNAWFAKEASQLLPSGAACGKCGHSTFRKETDIMDVWFDSGSSHAAVLEKDVELSSPADLYLEGSDQHRGWFQSSLLTSVATKGVAPYKAVLTHGYVVDGDGRKMSKSLGNVIAPQEVIKDNGADILRLWVAASDFKSDIRASKAILQQTAEVYRKIRNTMRFLMANCADFDPVVDRIDYQDMSEIDQWALDCLDLFLADVTKAYHDYEFHSFYQSIRKFCIVDMSSTYLDIIKERLYVEATAGQLRRSSQTVLHEILNCLVRVIAPVLVFTAEESWSYLAETDRGESSVHLAQWPKSASAWADPALRERWNKLLLCRDEVTKVMEHYRQEKIIGNSLEASLTIMADADMSEFLCSFPDLRELLIVSKVAIIPYLADTAGFEAAENIKEFAVKVEKMGGGKCPRCWVWSEEQGTNSDHPELCPRCTQVVLAMPVIADEA